MQLVSATQDPVADPLLGNVRIELHVDDSGDLATLMQPNAEEPKGGVSRLRRTTPGGRVVFDTVPEGLALKLSLAPEEAAPNQIQVPALNPGETRTLTVEVRAGISASGVVLDPDGLPVAGARLEVLKRGRAMGFDDKVVRETEAATDGTFVINGLAAGPGKGSFQLRADHDAWLHSKGQELDLQDGESLEGIEITLREGRNLHGVCRFADGRVAAGVDVLARFDAGHIAGAGALSFLKGRSGRTASNDQGEFEIRGLGAGPFVVSASAPHPDDRGGPQWRVRRDGVRPNGKGDSETALVLELRTGLGLKGRVLDDLGAPTGGRHRRRPAHCRWSTRRLRTATGPTCELVAKRAPSSSRTWMRARGSC